MFKTFLKSEEGANLIEFAFIAPVFFLIIVGTLDIGSMLVVQNALDASARSASRFGLTGFDSGLGDRDEAIRDNILDTAVRYSGGIIKRDQVMITVTAYPEIEAIETPEPYEDTNSNGQYDLGEFYEDINENGQWDNDQGTTGSFGAGGEAVRYEVAYDWPSFLSAFGILSDVRLRGFATVRNEDFR